MLRARLAVLLALVALVAACGSSGPSSDVTTGPTFAPATPTTEPAASEPVTDESATPEESQPVESEAPSESASPDASPSVSAEPDGSADPGASATTAAADGCTGSDGNKQFFVSVAQAVEWPVLCGALPQGWILNAGQYRLANGGKLTISYKGPAGATLALSEGAFCTDGSGCVPPGVDVGDAAMGPLTGTFVALDDGGFAIVVDRGAAISWLLEAHGVDEATTRSIAAALYEVAG
jgi:hypothetical protein